MEAAAPVLAYLIGSVPIGILLTRRSGVDLRTTGSGNIGATNVARTAGGLLAAATLLGDVLKGLVPVILARSLEASPAVLALTAVGAVLGHVFSLFLGLRGGKGVSTGFGAFLGLAPAITPWLAGLFVAVVAWTRIVSVASLAGAFVAPLVLVGLDYPRPYQLAGIAIGLLVAYRHRDNIERLRSGTEPRIGSR